MPDLRALLIAIGVGGGVAGYTILWWHWPVPIGAGVGILLAGLALTGSISVRAEGSSADAAWRAAAPDLQDAPAGPPADVPVRRGAAAPDVGPTARGHDLPSGD
jgi:hypothetical protein